jgi:hypothetical protein
MDRAGRGALGWPEKLMIALAIVLAGAAAATWGLARSQSAARFLGVVHQSPPKQSVQQALQQTGAVQPANSAAQQTTLNPAIAQQISALQARLQRVESESKQVQGSAGRADSLLIAFAARRAMERGVSLGYLEPLLVDRFASSHPQAVATIVTASRSPVRISTLIAGYQDLEPELLGPPPNESLWNGLKRGFSSIITVHRSDRPSSQPLARYPRALSFLMTGEVDSALAETMRLPGAPRAREWIGDARRYVAVRRALDEIESAALIGAPKPAAP